MSWEDPSSGFCTKCTETVCCSGKSLAVYTNLNLSEKKFMTKKLTALKSYR